METEHDRIHSKPAELAGAIVPPRDAAEGGQRQSARAA